MCRLLETIKVCQNTLYQPEYHTARVNRSRDQLFGDHAPWDLSTIIKIPDLDPGIVYRCRFLYALKPERTEFIPYTRRIIRKLFVVDGGSIEYSFKYADRQNLETLRQKIPEDAEILIVKDGFVTDASIANLVFTDGKSWYTPSTPLLKGTKRQYYLDRGEIHEREIRITDLKLFKSVRLINAMIDLYESDDISVGNIQIQQGRGTRDKGRVE